jgi:hypothetical protein
MTDVRKTLVSLFARFSCDEIESKTQYVCDAFATSDYNAIRALPNYSQEYGRIRKAKATIETYARNYPEVTDQALQCLNWLKTLHGDTVYPNDDYLVTRELIEKTLFLRGPRDDQLKFKQRRKLVDEWTDFFLSYTNRDAHATNDRYRGLINSQLGWPGKKEADSHNYLARVIVKFFEQRNIRAFVDFKNLQCGDDIQAKVFDHCRSTFAFVQLIEGETLVEPKPPDKNWCHLEYSEFIKSPYLALVTSAKLNCRFYLLAGLAKPAPPGIALYQSWFNDVSGLLALVIDNHNARPFDSLRLEISNLAAQIRLARDKLIEEQLATWG